MKTSTEERLKLGVFLGICAAVIGAGWLGVSALTGGEGEDPVEPTADGAADVCHQSVDLKLKAPATADYTDESTETTGDTWVLTGWVDAENSFGAQIRTAWRCEAEWTGGHDWSVFTELAE